MRHATSYYAELEAWATPAQVRYLRAVVENNGNESAAARALGVNKSVVQRGLHRVKANAAAHGYSPDEGLTRVIPAPFIARGHSTLDKIHDAPVGPDGRQQVLQWTKTRLDDLEWLAQVEDGINSYIDGLPHEITIPDGPLNVDSDIIPWIQIGDAHLGLLAHEAEVGANFDLKIAERELLTAILMLLEPLHNVERIVINDLGDFTHYENFEGVTQQSGNPLDYDGRFPKMITVYARIMRTIIDMALTKAQNVDVIINQGNHSRTNDIWMATLLREVYGPTGRVNVLNNHSPFIGYRMGNTLVMTHHSDKTKPNRLAQVMTTDFRKDYGETEFHYIDIGHIHHHMRSTEHPGVIIESWNILAPADKWAYDSGYRSRQSISVVFRSKKYGDIGRTHLPIQQIRDRIREIAATSGKAVPYMPQPIKAFTV
jgi:hypothetical protein